MKTTSLSSTCIKKVILGTLAVFCMLASLVSQAQVLRHPADVTPILGTPYTLFLSEYAEPGNNHLTATVLFNDFNEPQWDFRFRLTIESNDIRLTTSPNFIPSAPITVTPGVPVRISSEDWAPYFDYNNLIIEGQSRNQLIRTGRIPEGFYSFCLEVLDYQTGDVLSRKSCTSAWIQLNETARMISPQCGKFIDPKNVQIPIQWQLFNTQSPNASMGTTHQLTIWEMLDGTADPLSVVANGQALQVFQSEPQSSTTYIYGPADPMLELGKHYVFRVQSFDPEGKDTFKNNGYSEFCHFYYGWPDGGKIDLIFPKEEGGFRRREVPMVEWSSVDNMIPGQWVSYRIEIGEMDDTETPDEDIHFDRLWYEREILPSSKTYDRKANITQMPEITKKYIWRVIAFTDDQEVGRSDAGVFYGPPLVERFYAGGHKVWVDAISNADLDSLCGYGRIRFSPGAHSWVDVRFSGIKLKDNGGYLVLDEGEFYHDLEEPLVTELTPEVESNQDAYFNLERYRVDKSGISAYGDVTWDLPFATTASEKAVVTTEKEWVNYNEFKVNGALGLVEDNTYELLDPYKFILDLFTSSEIYVNSNDYRFVFNGHVVLPDNVVGTQDNEPVTMPFYREEQIFYMENEDPQIYNHVSVLNQARMDLRTSFLTIDLSETESPARFTGQKDWKGVYFNDFELRYNSNVDASGQVILDGTYSKYYSLEANGTKKAWVTSGGLNFRIQEKFADSDKGKFNTFPSKLNEILLNIENSRVTGESWLTGEMMIPVVSVDDPFTFTIPISNLGFRSGYLDDLDDTAFTFSKGNGEQELHIVIHRAVFADNNRLNMTIDLDWPALGVQMKSLVGFKAWGDYSIGFNTKNGSLPLTKRLNANMSGYPVILHTVGAGSGEGFYSFASTLDAQLGNDVAGGAGAPQVNVYSLEANKFLPKDQVVSNSNIIPDESPEEQIEKAKAEFEAAEASLQSKLLEGKEGAVASAESLKKSLLASGNAQAFEVTEIYSGPGFDPGEEHMGRSGGLYDKLSPDQQEQFNELVTGVVAIIAQPITEKIEAEVGKVRDKVTGKIDEVEKKAIEEMESKIDAIIKTVADELISNLQNDKIDVVGPITEISEFSATSIKKEITSSFHKAVQDNITQPIVTLLDDGVSGRVNNLIIEQGSEIVYTMFEGGDMDLGALASGVGEGMTDVVTEIGKDALNMVSPDKLSSTVQSLATDFVSNIDAGAVAHDIASHIDQLIKNAIKDAVNDKVNEVASKYANEILNVGLGDSQIPIDFVDIGGKLASGDIKGVFATDPVRVLLNTPVVTLDGYINYTPDDVMFGDVWSGDVVMGVKVPKPFELKALYFNGKKGDVNYWFCQIDPVGGGSGEARQPGDVLGKEPKELSKPVNLGIVQLVGLTGRLYHHMSEQPSGVIVPDAAMKYGAYLNMVMFDQGGGSTMRLQLAGEINSKTNGDYTVSLEGNAQMMAKNNSVVEGDKSAAIQGIVQISYNSAEQHFLGYARVDLKNEAVCASGNLTVDVKPGQWRVALGNREDRLIFVPGCVGWSPTGWLDVNQNIAELGLGVSYSIEAKSPTVNLWVVKFNVEASAGIAFGVVAAVQYKPNFAIAKAGVWVDLWATLDVNYQTKKLIGYSSWKRFTLVDIFVRGDLAMIFIPSPTRLEGNVRGHVKVLCFKKSFNSSLSMSL